MDPVDVHAPVLRVEVAISHGPQQVELVPLHLPAGSTVADALARSGQGFGPVPGSVEAKAEGAPPASRWGLSVWGRLVEPTALLREGDRVELTRGLQVDPKEARRLRWRSQAERLEAFRNSRKR